MLGHAHKVPFGYICQNMMEIELGSVPKRVIILVYNLRWGFCSKVLCFTCLLQRSSCTHSLHFHSAFLHTPLQVPTMHLTTHLSTSPMSKAPTLAQALTWEAIIKVCKLYNMGIGVFCVFVSQVLYKSFFSFFYL